MDHSEIYKRVFIGAHSKERVDINPNKVGSQEKKEEDNNN
jgi:hypothetical protein